MDSPKLINQNMQPNKIKNQRLEFVAYKTFSMTKTAYVIIICGGILQVINQELSWSVLFVDKLLKNWLELKKEIYILS